MNTYRHILIAWLVLLACAGRVLAQGSAFTYQGRLNDGVSPANGSYDLRFALFDALSGGVQTGTALTNAATAVSNGLFTVPLDFGAQFPGADRWLELGVRTNGGGSFSTLNPRQQITATPYSVTAGNLTGTLPAAQLSGTVASGNLPASPSFSGTVTANSISGNGANVTNVNAATLDGLTAANFWQTNGNAGANPTNGAFLGTTDFLPFEIRVGNQRALRIEPKNKPPTFTTPTAPNVTLGYSGNVASNSNFGATILGGGDPSGPNTVLGSWGTVVGGLGNTAGQNALAMGNHSTASGHYSVAIGDQASASVSDSFALGYFVAATNGGAVALGYGTVAGGSASTAMGDHSRASGQASTAMGLNTIASGAYATAMGGGTRATNDYATALGSLTIAGGVSSTAMGHLAKALHDGTFVWADTSDFYGFSSTSTNQFLILATGGVGINTNNPGNAALNVNGAVVATSFVGDGSGLTGLPSGGSNGPVTLAQLPAAVMTNGASGVTLSGTFTGNGSGLTNLMVTNLVGSLLDARLCPNVALLNANQTFTGVNTFSSQVTASGGVRLNDERLWLRSDNNHGLGWCGNGHPFAGVSDTIDGPVLFGWKGGALGTIHDDEDTQQFNVEKIALVWNVSGNVGIGKMDPAAALDVAGTVMADQLVADQVAANDGMVVDRGSLNNGTLNPGLTFGFSSGEGIASKRTDGGNKYGLDFYTAGNPRLSILNGGNVGIGNLSPASKLDVGGQMRAQGILSTGAAPLGSSLPSSKFAFASDYSEGTFNNWNNTGNNADCRRLLGAEDYHCGFGEAFGNGIASPVIWMYESSGNAFEVRKVGYNQQVPSGQKLFAVHSDGTTEVQVLEITGGSDLAEPFHVSDADIPKGALMIIDEEHPGQLKLSSEPYDHRVAGIISGANGINPGLTLHQQGKLEGGKNVALSGRVYALADATDEAIKPGDLLTSSSIPGHLMKASDRSRAHGAIVGKAMSALQKGKGMVLVLVSLQ